MRILSNVFFMAAMISLCCVNPVAAGLIPVLEYQFPASSSDLVTNTTITDVSSGAHNGTASSFTGTGLSSTVPSGAAAGTSSASFSGSSRIVTNDTQLLTSTAIATAGGFTWDLWLYATDTDGSKKIIDYAGTDSLRQDGNTLSFFGLAETVSANTWYHVVATFDTKGNSAIADPNYSGYYQITGVAALTVNGKSAGTANYTKTGYGDFLGRSIGIGNHPVSEVNECFIGNMYDVKISLGVASIPEPSTMLSLSSGALALLAYAWRKRK